MGSCRANRDSPMLGKESECLDHWRTNASVGGPIALYWAAVFDDRVTEALLEGSMSSST